MAKQVQIRGSTAADHASFAGATREITFDTTNNRIVAHANSKVGGYPAIHENGDKGLDLNLTGNANIVSKNITLKDSTLDSSLSLSSSGIRLRDNNIDKLVINGSDFTIKDNSNINAASLQNRVLYDLANNISLNWNTYRLIDATYSQTSIDWGSRIGYAAGGLQTINWNDGYLYDEAPLLSIDWQDKILYKDIAGNPQQSLNWNLQKVYDNAGTQSIDWSGRKLIKSNGSSAFLDWENGLISKSDGIFTINVEATYPIIGGIGYGAIEFDSLNGINITDKDSNGSIYAGTRYLSSPNNKVALNWNTGKLYSDFSNTEISLDWYNKKLMNGWSGYFNKIGINTDNPGYSLEIDNSSNFDNPINIITSDGSSFTMTTTDISSYANNTIKLDAENKILINSLIGTENTKIGVKTINPAYDLDVNGTIRASALIITGSGNAPASRTSNGTIGQMTISGGYLYIATGNNLWGRVALFNSDTINGQSSPTW